MLLEIVMNLRFCFACQLIKEITEEEECKFFWEWGTAGSDYGEPARISGCLDYVTLTPRRGFQKTMYPIHYQSSVLCFHLS